MRTRVILVVLVAILAWAFMACGGYAQCPECPQLCSDAQLKKACQGRANGWKARYQSACYHMKQAEKHSSSFHKDIRNRFGYTKKMVCETGEQAIQADPCADEKSSMYWWKAVCNDLQVILRSSMHQKAQEYLKEIYLECN